MSTSSDSEVRGHEVSVTPLHQKTVPVSLSHSARSGIRVLIDKGAHVYEIELPSVLETAVYEALFRVRTRTLEPTASQPRAADQLRRLLRHPKRSEPELSQWDELVGPFYKASAIAKWRDQSRQNVSKLTGRGSLLALRTEDGACLYPAFQFDGDGNAPPRLKELLRLLRSAIADDWTIALWLNNPQHILDGRTPIELLWDSNQADRVFTLAHDEVGRRVA